MTNKKSTFIVIFSIIVIVIAAILIYVINNKLYYSNLPVNGLSKKEAWEIGKNSNNNISLLSKDNKNTWYISELNPADSGKRLIQQLEKSGCNYSKEEGNSIFFMKNDQQLIAEKLHWGKFVLIKVPNH